MLSYVFLISIPFISWLFLCVGFLLRTDGYEFSGFILFMPSHVSTQSPSDDSFSKENQPLKWRWRVRSYIQMNIEEISTVQVQAEDVPEDILITNLPANEVC
jgi:hypothetical protein